MGLRKRQSTHHVQLQPERTPRHNQHLTVAGSAAQWQAASIVSTGQQQEHYTINQVVSVCSFVEMFVRDMASGEFQLPADCCRAVLFHAALRCAALCPAAPCCAVQARWQHTGRLQLSCPPASTSGAAT
jgi:hypothetical protein